MRRRKAVAALAAALPTVASCDALQNLTGGDCTTVAVPAISITVIDSVTRAGLFQGTTVRAIDGSYIDSVTMTENPGADIVPISLAFEHAGTFRVTVTHPGYIAWIATDVRVKKDGCHVQTAQLTADLVRVP